MRDAIAAKPVARITELDGVRGLAILLVLIWHYVQNQIVPGSSIYLAELKNALIFTWSGVDLFFVLSGFLIGGILLDNRNATNYFKVFYLRRFFRIFPLYYGFILLFVILVYLGAGDSPSVGWVFDLGNMSVWSYVSYTQNIFMAVYNEAGPRWLDVTWSLAVEEQFYLLLPLIIRFVPKDRLMLVLLWFIIGAPYLRATMPGLSAYINAPWRADCLFLGVLLAYGVRVPGFWDMAMKYRSVIYAFLFGLILCVAIMAGSSGLTLGGTYTHLVLAILYSTLILAVMLNRTGIMARVLRLRILVWLGSISYGVYLIHQAVSAVLHGLLRNAYPGMVDLEGVGVTVMALGVTLFLAHMSYHYFERRIIRFGRTFRYEN